MQANKKIRILEVADRPGWAIDRLSRPLSQIYENVDMSYFNVRPDRYLDTGYSPSTGNTHYTHELGNKYDVVHFHRLEATVLGLSMLRPEIKRVITVHTERHEDYDDKRLVLFDDIICPTKYAQQRLLDNLKKWDSPDTKIHQVSYGIDLKQYRRTPSVHHVPHGIDLEKFRLLNLPPRPNEVGYVGRVVSWKRYDVIQKAVHQAGLKLIACGFIERGDLQNVHNLTEKEDFEFYDFLPEPLMPNFYARMNLFICLSEPHIEAGPLPVLEAMAMGVPVISTRVGWPADQCEHLKNIYFVEENEVDKLVDTIKMLYSDNVLCKMIRSEGLKLIKDFSIEKYAEKLMEIYNK